MARDRRTLAMALVLCVGALTAPFMGRSGPVGPSFVTAVVALVACFDLISVSLLAGQFRDTGDRRVLVLALSYVWSLVVMAGYASAFPGVLGAHPPLQTWPSVAPYLWVSWHAGFPLLIGLAYAPWPAGWRWATPGSQRGRELGLGVAVAVVSGAALVVAVTHASGVLPSVISGTDTSAMTRVCGPWMAAAVVIGTALAWRGLHDHRGPERWAVVACLSVAVDVTLTLASRHRYSVGWYVGRTLTVVAAGVVLAAMLAEFARIRRRLLVEASTDALTGLANRAAAMRALDRAAASGHGWAVVLMDLDRFKAINDTLGHSSGDEVVVETGRRAARAVRGWDPRALVARLGGDELLALLPAPDGITDAVLAVADRLVLETSRPYDLPERRRTLTSASIGVSWLRAGGDVTDALRQADLALYRSKAAGGACRSVFDDSLRAQAGERSLLEAEVRRVVADDAVRVHLQPVVSLDTGAVVGAEALLRVVADDGQEHLPPGFIEVAEELGAIAYLDAAVLETACGWLRSPGDVPLLADGGWLSVNMSARTLAHPDFEALLGDAVAQLPAGHRLTVEITETALLRSDELTAARLGLLRAAGIRVALDDFGTGYSSLSRLRSLDLDVLKVDGSFVRGLAESTRSVAVMRAIVDLAAAIGCDLVAEGVETESQRDLLLSLGVRHAQGWLYSPAVPPSASPVTARPAREWGIVEQRRSVRDSVGLGWPGSSSYS